MTTRGTAIGPYQFSTKLAAKERIRGILYGTELGSFLAGDDFNLICWLLNRHSEVDTKVGAGITALSVNTNTMGSRSFWIHRIDGSVVDFSYRHALDGKPNHRQEVLAALRWEVDGQIISFRDWYFSQHADAHGRVQCPITGLWITRREAHVDHIIRFVDLADYFIAWAGGYEQVSYRCAEIGAHGWLTDRQLGNTWQTWHQQNAQLRIIESKANLMRNRRGAQNASM
jgi:hypothetical protein